ncbi:hypothetical protein Scep_013924 [Stephania cephalantha]|uniref:F-box protein n=1 Tax=Stephania cephalantha TaxID=152367 RepID=A0AAP0NZV6_9MAGN
MQVSATPNPDDHRKLCGFCCVVLSVTQPQRQWELTELSKTLEIGTPCHLYTGESNELGFRTDHGVLLSLIRSNSSSIAGESELEVVGSGGSGLSTPHLGKRKGFGSAKKAKKRRVRVRVGVGQGDVNVVRELNVLVGQRCLEIAARVVGVSVRGDGSARAVVLVDVFLPVDVWAGWQFPKSGARAAAVFRHLSSDWERRNSIIVKFTREDEGLWDHSGCHVLGCKVHCSASESSKKKKFDLHEIFKSLPGIVKEGQVSSSKIIAGDVSYSSGIWDVSDDILVSILAALTPRDLVRVAATCRHLRSLAVSIMPCMKLRLFPHQHAAIEWMLERERSAKFIAHPLYMDFSTEDGFHFYINSVSGEIATGAAPTVADFHGGMFCDEPGLGKTITALSLILKTQGTLADPPDGIPMIWCAHNNSKRCGYYELSADSVTHGNIAHTLKRFVGNHGRRGHSPSVAEIPILNIRSSSLKSEKSINSDEDHVGAIGSCPSKLRITSSSSAASSSPATCLFKHRRSMGRAKRNLLGAYAEECRPMNKFKKPMEGADSSQSSETWVQCDACHKWRKVLGTDLPDATAAWFCSMNTDPFHQNCAAAEESWDRGQSIMYLPGFYTKGTPGGMERNISFFTSVLKENCTLINFETKKALTWLAKLSGDKLLKMETTGLIRPVLDTKTGAVGEYKGYHKIFQAFGLVKKVERGITRWFYPHIIGNLSFDVVALQIALTKPLDLFRLYLSGATLVVVPANLVDHWKTQILKHVKPGHLRVFVWTDHKRPLAHSLAWDYDIVITTFSRLSAEWGPRKRSVLMQVHWLRIILDEGHTLGSSLSLTNKLQMAISLTASNRWLLTGTPTPNTPNSQVSHLQPLFKFLHEEVYGQSQKLWEAGILRPFEAEMEEGRSRLLQLLQRCMISARKADLHAIPPCVKKVTFLDFTKEHASSYNELVVTVRRNILMADWNDPSHVESLLNPKQWKFRSTTIRNVRLSCCVAGHIKVTHAGHDIQETMDILVEQGLDSASEEYAFIKHSLLDGGSCFRCKDWCRLPVITPCRHLLCLDCVALDSEKCALPGCGNVYEMQKPEKLARPENPNPKWPVPKDLIELQPSYKQASLLCVSSHPEVDTDGWIRGDDWDPDWQSTSSSKVAYLVERLKTLQEANIKLGYAPDENGDAQCSSNDLLSSKKYPWKRLVQHETFSGRNSEPYKLLPEKVIIFSQFLEHIHVIEQQLTFAGIKFTGMYSPMHSSNKMKSLAVFQHDESCMALLMDGSAALGLDLSFVSHVFLMEPIWDRSTEEQVISRAHRMGASRPIYVETLAMRGTIEEQMLEFLKDPDQCRRTLKGEFGNGNGEGARTLRTLHDFAGSNYLAQISFVRKNLKP